MQNIINIEKLTKKYYIYESKLDRLKDILFSNNVKKKEFIALDKISFSLRRSETVGIIGINGSGKSTLLKIIAGIVKPTYGKIQVNGDVSAIIELGIGFNDELSGYENIFLNCMIHGKNKEFVNDNIEKIMNFSELEDFIYRPVKTYSSGMRARLAFSISINIEANILIIDEALSVGDAKFQQKCFKKIRQLQKKGTTILFVSHSLDSIVQLCDRAVLLDKGKLITIGKTKDVVDKYNEMLFGNLNKENLSKNFQISFDESEEDKILKKLIIEASQTMDGGKIFKVLDTKILNKNMQPFDSCVSGERINIVLYIKSNYNINNISIAVEIFDKRGMLLTGESIFNKYNRTISFNKNETKKILFSFMAEFLEDDYFVQLRINRLSLEDRSDNILLYINEQVGKFTLLKNYINRQWFKVKKSFNIEVENI